MTLTHATRVTPLTPPQDVPASGRRERLREPRAARPRSTGRMHGRRIGYVYVLPFFLVFAAFSIYPWLDTAWVSLHDVRLSTYDQQTWVGLGNYRDLFTNPFFWNAFRNTVTIGVISTVPQLCMALGIAHLLNYRLRGRTFFRVAMLMPYATSVAAATLVFAQLFSRDAGLINWLLGVVGVNPVDWRNGSWAAQIAISSIIIWRWTGYNALIYLAGMQSISQDLYEAAALDGANAWQQFRHVTLPGLRPTILFTIVVSTIGASQVFGEPLIFGGGAAEGGALGQYQTLGLFLYQQGWQIGQLGRAAAVAWVMFLMIVVLVLVNSALARRRERAA